MMRQAFAMAILAAFAFANPPAHGEGGDLLSKYTVKRIYKGKPAPVNLRSHKRARRFRTRLRRAAKRGPNFAGHMTVASWGCGTSCQMIALIDARTGRVRFGPAAELGVKHRLTSNLLIVNPPENIRAGFGGKPPQWAKTRYYLWVGGRLIRIRRP